MSVRAVTDARLFELTNQHLYQLYHHDVKTYVMILQNINRELCRRLRKSEGRITQLADDARQEVTQITSVNPLPSYHK